MTIRLAAVLALITFGIYVPALQTDFVAGDRQFLLNNELAGDVATALRSFIADYWGILGGESFVYYRPLTVLTHCLDVNLWGLNPIGHHLTNIVLHTTVTLLVYALFLKMLPGKPLLCFTAALLFGLHPVHTHSVVYVMGRTDVLAALFYLLALLMLCRPHISGARMIISGLCFLAGLLSKEMAITLPFVFGLYCVCMPGNRPPWPRCVLAMIVLGTALLVYMGLRIWAIGMGGETGAAVAAPALWQQILLICMTLGFYCGKLLLPVNLCYYSNLVVPYAGMSAGDVLLVMAGVLCAAAMIVFARRGPAGFACAWIGITLLPVLNIVPLPVLAKENYLYLPSAGFCLLAALMFDRLRRMAGARMTAALVIGVLLLYGLQTVLRTLDYRDPVLYLKSAVHAMRPVSAHQVDNPHYFEGAKNWFTTCRNLGYLYRDRQTPDKAQYWFTRALEYSAGYFDPRYAAQCHLALGELFLQQGRTAEATAHLNAALSGAQHQARVYNLLGVAAAMRNDPQSAEGYFVQALAHDPGHADARANLNRLQRIREQPMPESAER